jgi:hypothetical protein
LDRLLDLHGQVQLLLAQSKRRGADRDRYLEALRLIASCKVQVIGDVVDIAQKALLKKAMGESKALPKGQRMLDQFAESTRKAVEEHVAAGRGRIKGNRLVPNEDE